MRRNKDRKINEKVLHYGITSHEILRNLTFDFNAKAPGFLFICPEAPACLRSRVY
jgi:hypothetical protein